MKKNVLVFPCGSEVGLEINRSLRNSIHVNLFGASSVDDHGKFVFENYISGLPFYDQPHFINHLSSIIKEYDIDAIIPAMDNVLAFLKEKEQILGCKVVCSELDTVLICLSKLKTYEILGNSLLVPKMYKRIGDVPAYPVFLKPDIGYGSRGTLKAFNQDEVESHLKKHSDQLILEYLPGREYTVDCFTNFHGDLLFYGPRERKRVQNGISVNSSTIADKRRFSHFAEVINKKLKMNGAWFFQIKENLDGELCLLEVASRIGGSSSVHRMKGVNFALLSLFNSFEVPVGVEANDYEVEMDRALSSSYKVSIEYNYVYVDFDDTLLINNRLNSDLIACLYELFGKGKKIILITKHVDDINETLEKYRIRQLFDEVIHLSKKDKKFKFFKNHDAIFIDDSFQERTQTKKELKIPVFAPDMVPSLI